MADVPLRARPGGEPLEIERVEVAPGEGGDRKVTVLGRCRRVDPGVKATLVLSGGDASVSILSQEEVVAEPASGSDSRMTFRARFALPDDLVSALAAEARLELDGLSAALPALAVGATKPRSDSGQLVDPAVLAERRARRLGLAGEATAQRSAQSGRTLSSAPPGATRSPPAAERQAGVLLAAERKLMDSHAASPGQLEALRNENLRRGALLVRAEEGLAQARRAIARAASRIREMEDAGNQRYAETDRLTHVALHAELEEARAARSAADALVEVLRRELEHRDRLSDRALALIDELQSQVRTLTAADGAPRPGEAAASEQDHELVLAADDALAEAERRIAQALAAAAQVEQELISERALREALADEQGSLKSRAEQAERSSREFQDRMAELLKELDEERAKRPAPQTAPDEERERAQRQVADLRLELRRLREAGLGVGLASSPTPWLAGALSAMARTDPDGAGRLALALLPAQALSASRALDYDIVLAEHGPHAVSLDAGRGTVQPLSAPRPTRETDFRLELGVGGLVELLVAGGSRRLRRRGRVRVRGTMRPNRALSALGPVPLQLSALEGAGASPDPSLLYRALVSLIDPRWTRGHRFSIAHEVTGAAPATWHVHIDDGAPPLVTSTAPAKDAAATVRLSPASLRRLVESAGPGRVDEASALDRVAIRGDLHAAALLARWMDWARGMGSPPSSH